MVSHWPAPHTHHQLPHPGARHPRLLPLTAPWLAVRPWKSPFPSVPGLSTGDICNNHSTCSKGEREPRVSSCVLGAQESAYPWEVREQQVRESRDHGGQWVGVGMSSDMWRLKELCFQT